MPLATGANVVVLAILEVPVKFPIIVPQVKPPDESRATMVLAVFKLVASEVNVTLVPPAWFAVKVPEPEI